MLTAMTTKNIIILSCDAAFFPLAQGTILSLQQQGYPNAQTSLAFLDIGLTPEQNAWCQAQGCWVKTFAEAGVASLLPQNIKNYNKAQNCRPLLPKIFPGADVYMWVDTDIWFQTPQGVQRFLDDAAKYNPAIIIVPTVDMNYGMNYGPLEETNMLRLLTYADSWMRDAYGDVISAKYMGRSLFSSGIFALSATSPMWQMWQTEIADIYTRDHTKHPYNIHYFEQAALNKVIYDTQLFIPLPSCYNYNAHFGGLYRDEASGLVQHAFPPCATIDVIHLTLSSRAMAHYFEQRLLFEHKALDYTQHYTALTNLQHYFSDKK
jgi:hypothetical protein